MAQNAKDGLAKDFGVLYRTHLLSDFIVQASDGQEFMVHRNILAARSKVFQAMLTMEDSKEVETGRCEVRDVNGPTMDMLLKYVYGTYETGSVKDHTKALALLYAAEKYDLPDLVEVCSQILVATLNVGNAADVLMAADQFKLLILKVYALDKIARDRREFFRSGHLERIRSHSVELMEEILKGVRNRGEMPSVTAVCRNLHHPYKHHTFIVGLSDP